MENITFKGYKDIIENFWGITFTPNEDVLSSDWWQGDVLFAGSEDNEEFMDIHTGENDMEVTIKYNDKEYTVLSLACEGGFYAYLFKPEDYSDTIEYIIK
jgi:hypothetical protein